MGDWTTICSSAETWDQSINWKNKAFKSVEECWFAYSFQGCIPRKKQLCCSFFFFFPTQLSSLRNEVCCAGILFPVHSPSCSSAPYANLWKQSTFLLHLTLGGSSFHHITAIQPINHPLFYTRKNRFQVSENPKSALASFLCNPLSWSPAKINLPWSKQRIFWGILKEFLWKSKESSAGTALADVDWSKSDRFWGFRSDPWEREARSPNSLSDTLT